ncbi:MAG: serine--tRNA ligase [Clostridiales bacterium]|jgi:seryl-tRNA synthetase|nr:serine--tRNA ligase [Clostridiales bacterium]
MLDLKELRSNFDAIKTKLSKRQKDYELEKFLEMDKQRRALIQTTEELKSKQNTVSKQVPLLKKEGKDAAPILEEMKALSDQIKALEPELKTLDDEIDRFLLNIPNTPSESVPEGLTDADNLELRKWGEPTAFSFEPKPHWELGKALNILDAETGAKVTGTRFTFYKGLGARLERAIINFMLDTHTGKHGYTEVFPPFMVNRKSMQGTGQLPKFEEDAFKISDSDYFLVPTAEVPVTNMYRDDILNGADLTLKYCAYTACFRAEAGSAGRDTRGLIRQHQFNKVELVKFSRPENSYAELEALTNDAEHILQLLGLPYRVVKLCAGDLGFSSAMTYDIEVWMPSYNRYVEISSCSNFEAYQARRANIKYKDNIQDKAQFVHTLNGSGLAAGRTTAAIIENFQQADGSILVPEALVPYMQGIKEIKYI